MLETEQRSVRGQRATWKATAFAAAGPDVLTRSIQLPRPRAAKRHVAGEALAVPDPGGDDPGRLDEPVRPAIGNAVEERPRLAAVERLHDPGPCLVAALVLEPEDALAVERGEAVDDSDGVVARLAGDSGVGVECVDLPAAGLVGGVDGAVRRERRPL